MPGSSCSDEGVRRVHAAHVPRTRPLRKRQRPRQAASRRATAARDRRPRRAAAARAERARINLAEQRLHALAPAELLGMCARRLRPSPRSRRPTRRRCCAPSPRHRRPGRAGRAVGHPVDHRPGGDPDHRQARRLRLDDRNAERLVGHRRDVDVGAGQPARQLAAVADIAGQRRRAVAAARRRTARASGRRRSAPGTRPARPAGAGTPRPPPRRASRRRAGRHRSAAAGRRRARARRASAGCAWPGRTRRARRPAGRRRHRLDAERAQLGRAAILAQREHRVEAAVEDARNSDSRCRAPPPPSGRAEQFATTAARRRRSGNRCSRRRPAPSPGWRGDGRSPPTADYRRPGTRSGRGDALQRGAHRAIAQQQAVIGAARHLRRGDRDGDRAAVLLDRPSSRAAGNDQQVAVRASCRGCGGACAADRCRPRRRRPTSFASGRKTASAVRKRSESGIVAAIGSLNPPASALSASAARRCNLSEYFTLRPVPELPRVEDIFRRFPPFSQLARRLQY